MFNFFSDSENLIYSGILAGSIVLTGFYFLFNKELYLKDVNLELKNNRELFEYSLNFLDDIFSVTDYDYLKNDFLNDRYLYNFFKNFSRLIPAWDMLIVELPSEIKLELYRILTLFNDSPSFEKFKKLGISKKAFFYLILSIKKNVFMVF